VLSFPVKIQSLIWTYIVTLLLQVQMSIEESLGVARIYSVADQLPAGTPLIRHRPFRALRYTISHAGLLGGGNIPKPTEVLFEQQLV
jgi:predicted ATPase with chaperone activity